MVVVVVHQLTVLSKNPHYSRLCHQAVLEFSYKSSFFNDYDWRLVLRYAPMSQLNSIERKTALFVALMIGLRVYGLFLIMPVFSIYAQELKYANHVLIGLAVGVYGLTQAIFQVPMGLLSDFWGRKRVIIGGLLIFCLGSIIAALADNIYWIIIGRLVQGMGAIASTGMALLADVSRPEQRAKMMAIVGACIGLAFMLSFASGPILSQWFAVQDLFWLTAIFAILGILLATSVKEPAKKVKKSFNRTEMLFAMRQKELLLLDAFVFILHASITAIFVVLPLLLSQDLGFDKQQHWKFYLPILCCSLFIMVPMIILQEKKRKHLSFMLAAIFSLSLVVFLLGLSTQSIYILAVLMILYFGFFNFLEAAMPSFLSRQADEKYRGAAMGVFSSAEFFGAFFGGLSAGIIMQWQIEYVFFVISGMLFLTALSGFLLLRKSD